MDQLYSIFRLDQTQLVTWEDLWSAPQCEWIDLMSGKVINDHESTGVKFMKINTKVPNQMVFITHLKAGSGYDYHIHDCKETITVLKGSCKVNNRKVIREKESDTFFKHTRHKVFAVEDSEIFVEFNRH